MKSGNLLLKTGNACKFIQKRRTRQNNYIDMASQRSNVRRLGYFTAYEMMEKQIYLATLVCLFFFLSESPVTASSFEEIIEQSRSTCFWIDSSPSIRFPLESLNKENPYLISHDTTGIDTVISARFSFCYDSIEIGELFPWSSRKYPPRISFFDIPFEEDYLEQTVSNKLFGFALQYDKENWHLLVTLDKTDHLFSTPIRPATPYCLEWLVRISSDSIARNVSIRVNGRPFQNIEIEKLNYKIRKGVLQFQAFSGNRLAGNLFFCNLATGTSWLGHPPQRPVFTEDQIARSGIRNGLPVLYSPEFAPLLVPSFHFATRYQIGAIGRNWDLPLYDSGPDSVHRDSLPVPLFYCDNRSFLFRVKHYDRNGNQSSWSAVQQLRGASRDSLLRILPVIKRAFYSLPGKNKPEKTLVKEQWYDFNVKMAFEQGWKRAGFVLFWANDSEYPFGNIKNRGGKFYPKHNYIYNVSFRPFGPPLRVIEKWIPGTYQSRKFVDTLGLYIDASRSNLRMNYQDSTLSCRVRFLKEAKTGPWSLRGVVFDDRDIPSILFYDTIRIKDNPASASSSFENHSRKKRILLSVLLTVTLFSFLAMKMRRKDKLPPKTVAQHPLLIKIRQYIEMNINRNIAISDLETHCGMSHSAILKTIRKATGKSIKDLILEIKIEKAKDLLLNTDSNVNDVMTAVGFIDLPHFSRTFKRLAGISPQQFRAAKKQG